MDDTVGYGGGWISIGSECVFENLTENRAINIGGHLRSGMFRKKEEELFFCDRDDAIVLMVDIFDGFRFKWVDGNYIIILW